MKAVLLAVMTMMISIPADAAGSHSKKGYVKKDGTYVAPSHATNPNRSKADNYSSKGNTNPYTGKEGAKDPNAPAKKSKSK
jgi:hypothetical protein